MKIAIGSDHGGFGLKPLLIRRLKASRHRVTDLGTFSNEPCDYPVIGAGVAAAVSKGRVKMGVLLCKSGGGMGIVANKFPGVRAVVCETPAAARHAREHNDCNVLVLGAEDMSRRQAARILEAWLTTPFAGGRHARRVRQITQIERKLHARSS
ncbi:MAG: ribose 5-phosphate isomerase B [Candidatus Omnitrophota bacterium]|nr:ribose 5-phosphate isomerase B [Candidatus Omnitrophota bacterium]